MGRAAEDLKGHERTFAGDRFTSAFPQARSSTRELPGRAVQEAGRDRFTHTEGEAKVKTWLGIYLLEGTA